MSPTLQPDEENHAVAKVIDRFCDRRSNNPIINRSAGDTDHLDVFDAVHNFRNASVALARHVLTVHMKTADDNPCDVMARYERSTDPTTQAFWETYETARVNMLKKCDAAGFSFNPVTA